VEPEPEPQEQQLFAFAKLEPYIPVQVRDPYLDPDPTQYGIQQSKQYYKNKMR
jgi:hypothetical protein